jgi:hypothetical protein
MYSQGQGSNEAESFNYLNLPSLSNTSTLTAELVSNMPPAVTSSMTGGLIGDGLEPAEEMGDKDGDGRTGEALE